MGLAASVSFASSKLLLPVLNATGLQMELPVILVDVEARDRLIKPVIDIILLPVPVIASSQYRELQ